MLNSGELLGREGSSRKDAEGLGALVVDRTRLGRLHILQHMGIVTAGTLGLHGFVGFICRDGRRLQRLGKALAEWGGHEGC